MANFERTDRNRVRRLPKRGAYDHETIYNILDQAMICHVGYVIDGQPFVIPTLFARDEDRILLHGATTSRTLQYIEEGGAVCITVTHIDGLVLAKSVFHHSVNYRSAVLFGTGMLVEDPTEKMRAMELFTERILPGRWADVRPPNAVEFKATSVIAVDIESASAKVREGMPGDDEEDMALPTWAGVLPVRQTYDAPLPAPNNNDQPLPKYLREFIAKQ
jgi:uncharacterized protein